MSRQVATLILIVFAALLGSARQLHEDPDSLDQALDSLYATLDEVTVTSRVKGLRKVRGAAMNTDMISANELKRAACCNLGESFTTNPSVDVNYTDAATGARQIKLLGLAGTYVQMLTENIPNFRGAAGPYGLGYVPGPWIQSIQVSKGASSVKNGYEAMTGQINVEMKKPQLDSSVSANGYVDQDLRIEGNADANIHLSPRLSTGLLLHYENSTRTHDGNDDGFIDKPKVEQFAGMNRWAWMGNHYVFQAAVKYLDETRRSGQLHGHVADPYIINIDTRRLEAFTKNAYIFDRENDGNVALILSGSTHHQRAAYGMRPYDVNQAEFYASLMFERKWSDRHALSTGLSMVFDRFNEHAPGVLSPAGDASVWLKTIERVPGVYAQYTYTLSTRLIAMAGVRLDRSNLSGTMFTPRMHLKWTPIDALTFHASTGRGFRTPHVMADYAYLLASSRQIVVDPEIRREEGWVSGAGINALIPLGSRTLAFNAEYYYSRFNGQVVLDIDTDPHAAYLRALHGRSYSHTMQIDANIDIIDDLNLLVAYRFNDVRQTIPGLGLLEKPLTSRNKGLFTVAWTPMMGLWQLDVTLALNGGGRMPRPDAAKPLWGTRYKAFTQLNAQLTRNWRHWSVYIGGENLTGYRQKNPVICADNPLGPDFDATMVYGPLHGAMAYVGFRYNVTFFNR